MGGWANLTLVTDGDLGSIEPQAISTASPSPWGATTWPKQRARAKTELKVWIEAAFPTVVGAADRILDRHAPDYVFKSVASAVTDITSDAGNDTESDVNLAAIFTTPATDRLYVQARYQFEGLYIAQRATRNANASVLTVKYFGGNGWTALNVVDGTAASGATLAQSGRVTWPVPSDWQPIQLNGVGDEMFCVEISVSAALTSGTSLSQLLPIRPPDALKSVACYLALHFILQGLAEAAPDVERWQKKADHYWDRARELFTLLKEGGGIPLDINRDQSVSQAELTETTPIRLGRA